MGSESLYLRLSVHGLVDNLLRAGDIDDRVYNQETMEQGTLLHSSYQKKQKDNYLAEYPLAEVFKRPLGTIALQGRADGIIVNEGELPIIDELKSTVMDLDEFFEQQKEWHLGQAVCYALMYVHEKKLDGAKVRLTYISQTDSKKKATHDFSFTLEELEEKVHGYIDEFLELYQIQFEHQKKRDESIENLPFPYESFRPGQRELAKYAYTTGMKGGIFFAEAPTGIGKTISTLYPFVKSIKRGRNERLFYLTAKTTGAKVAYDAIGDLREKGLVCFDSYLLSRDKICFLPGHACNPDDCPYAKNYYGKVKEALLETAKSGKRFSQQTVIEVCMEKQLCPFEFQLDLSLYSDIIICDYNYFFDPFVYLERFFDEGVETSRYLVLVDEAHNLVDRGRMMYSSILSATDAHFAKKSLPKGPGYASLKKAIGKVETALLGLLTTEEKRKDFEKMPEEVAVALESLRGASLRFKKSVGGSLTKEAKDFFREANRLSQLVESYFGANFRLYATEEREGRVALNLFCLDASKYLSEQMERVRAAVLFSATFSPMSYFQKSIFGKEEYPYLLLDSPFPRENFKLLVAPKVSVRYKDRENTYAEIASYLETFVKGRKGNYFLYFPSFEYLRNIRSFLDFPGCEIHMQNRSMNQEEREAFLECFPPNPETTNVGLLVLGGAFSEGIDLVDDRLIGVGIVGIGLPMVCEENNMIREYAEKKGEDGFDVAYKNPGINKVMQAVGRLIRTETDVGAALLIDDRYARSDYRRFFARVWPDYELMTSPKEVEEALQEFYSHHKK